MEFFYWLVPGTRDRYTRHNALTGLHIITSGLLTMHSEIKVPAFEPLARGRVKKIILSQSSQTWTSYE
jgi:hypothetical protein